VQWAGGEREFAATSAVRFGRDPSCEVTLDNPNVSRVHAELRPAGDGWVLEDLGSSQGTYRSGIAVTTMPVVGPLQLVLGRPDVGETVDVSLVGAPPAVVGTVVPGSGVAADGGTIVPGAGTVLPADRTVTVGDNRPGGGLRPEALAGATVVTTNSARVECGGRSYEFQPGRDIIVGRDADCDVVSANPTVSRRHVALRFDGSSWRLEDLNSSGGTFVDGHRVKVAPLVGSTAVWLGDAETGERLVVVTGGTRRTSPLSAAERWLRGPRAALVIGGVALLAIVVALAALRTGGAGAPNNDALAKATVKLIAGDAFGSGSVVDAKQGLILTNAHVAAPRALGQGVALVEEERFLREDPGEVAIAVAPGLDRAAEIRYRGTVVAADGYLDLAIVKITKTASGALLEPGDLAGLRQIRIGDSDRVKTGSDVRVVGYPSIAESAAPTLTRGVVSGTVQDARVGTNRGYINVDADINAGNSGGMAVDSRGRIIGIPTLAELEAENLAKSNRLRPVNPAKALLDAARKGKAYASPYVTPPTGKEELTEFAATVPGGRSGFSPGCDRPEVAPAAGDPVLAVNFKYAGFAAGKHQDVRFDVVDVAGRKVIGRATSGDRYPFKWDAEGCANATIPLDDHLASGAYTVDVYIGPNYRYTGSINLDL
jgi:pSer/pThr/pTyr-binding forkhead associated (FHA) protein/S1-C subfamily serine protease